LLKHGILTLDPATRQLVRRGESLILSAREYALLFDLMSHPGHIRSRDQLAESLYAWGEERDSNIIEVYIHRLRKLLGNDAILTVRGLGYQLGRPG